MLVPAGGASDVCGRVVKVTPLPRLPRFLGERKAGKWAVVVLWCWCLDSADEVWSSLEQRAHRQTDRESRADGLLHGTSSDVRRLPRLCPPEGHK